MKIESTSMSVTKPSPYWPEASRLESPSSLAEQFSHLVQGQGQALKGGKTGLSARTEADNEVQPSLMGETVTEVARAEATMKGIDNQLNKQLHHASDKGGLNTNFVENIVRQKFILPFQFMGLNMLSSRASDVSDEVAILTKGRASAG